MIRKCPITPHGLGVCFCPFGGIVWGNMPKGSSFSDGTLSFRIQLEELSVSQVVLSMAAAVWSCRFAFAFAIITVVLVEIIKFINRVAHQVFH